jgi:hypothetical protein
MPHLRNRALRQSGKERTNHAPAQIFLLLQLEALQILQHARAGVLDVLLRHLERLLELRGRRR